MIEYRIGDVFERLAEIPDGSVDLLVTSPPFLALRSYLPADHPDKHREIGSEPTPAAFLDTLLALTAEWGRVLAPHGSICVELGDKFSGSQPMCDDRPERAHTSYGVAGRKGGTMKVGNGWPLSKSLTGIPTLYTWSLAYGRNLLRTPPTGRQLMEVAATLVDEFDFSASDLLGWMDAYLTSHEEAASATTIDPWRIRNVIVWARPNPPVGALGDKFRPATSYITVACKGPKRYFDLDAVRTEGSPNTHARGPASNGYARVNPSQVTGSRRDDGHHFYTDPPPGSGAPPLDWHADNHPEDGDWLWKLSTQPYKGSHYATFPLELPRRLILAMCPQRVCEVCGKPSERITERGELEPTPAARMTAWDRGKQDAGTPDGMAAALKAGGFVPNHVRPVIGESWSDCGHSAWRTGIVLDPFAGSGTTLEAAQAVGRHAIGIDLDSRNADLARDRVGMFLTVEGAA